MSKPQTKTPTYATANSLFLDPDQIRADWATNSRTKPKVFRDTQKKNGEDVTVEVTDGEADPLGNFTGSIEKLAESMKTLGQLQPVGVIGPDAKGKYDLVFGFRRYEAARLAGLKLWCSVTSEEASKNRALANFAENVARKNLTPYDIGRTCTGLLKAGHKAPQLADKVGLSRASINNYGRIFEKIQVKILEYWRDTPTGPVTINWLTSIIGMDAEKQLEAFRTLTAPPEEGATDEAEAGTGGVVKPKTRKVDDILAMLVKLEAGAFTGHMGPDWVKGASDALRYTLKQRDGLTEASEPAPAEVVAPAPN